MDIVASDSHTIGVSANGTVLIAGTFAEKERKAKHGKVYFYTPVGEQFDEKEKLLKLLKVEVMHCDCVTPKGTEDEKNFLYDQFYQKAILDILHKINASKL